MLANRMTAELERLYALRTQLDERILTEQERIRRHTARMVRFGHQLPEAPPAGHAEDLLSEVCAVMGVRVDDVTGRDRDHADTRHVVTRVLSERGLSSVVIGRLLGGRDHTTALYSLRRVDATPALAERARTVLIVLDAALVRAS